MATDWSTRFARRTAARDDPELATIMAGVPAGVLSMTGGFPNPRTFPDEAVEAITRRLVRDEPHVAMQYTPVAGLRSTREYLVDRQEQLHGVRPPVEELIVTSGGMEAIALLCSSLLDPGDVVAVEAPTYLGALLAFSGAEAGVAPIEMDADGLIVEALAERLAAGSLPTPKFLYVIPEHQNPTGRTMPLERRRALVELCRRHELLVVEDVAYRELAFDGEPPPSLWSLGPDVVVQIGTFSKTFFPGVRLGWAVGPEAVVAQLIAAKQTTDQCSGALGQRLVAEFGRDGGFERALPVARELYAGHWRALDAGLERFLPPSATWTRPAGGFLTWLTLPDAVDTIDLRPAALAAGIAYVPGRPFYAQGEGASEMRLSFSALGPDELTSAAERLGRVVAAALD